MESVEPLEHAPRRAFSRLRLGITAQLETLEGRQRVRLTDLSQGGAHVILSQDRDIRQGVLTWIRFETFGTVAWRDGVNIGLEFDKLLPLAVLVETRQRAPSVVRDEAIGTEDAAREWVAGRFNSGSER
jgi:hypothetical protein